MARVPGRLFVRSSSLTTIQTTTKRQTSLGRVTLLGLLLLLLIPSISAFGIKPAQKSLAFEPNLVYKGQFDLVRDTTEPGTAHISVEGDLAPYISLPQNVIPVSGAAQSIRYSLKLPETLSPGTHVGKIIVYEQAEASGVINSRIKITFKVLVTVPGEPIAAEVVDASNTVYIVPSATLETPQQISVNEEGLAFASLAAFAVILAIYAALILQRR